MKFSDIEQVTSEGNYQINVPLVDLSYIINRWVDDEYYQLQMCPDFQRGHVWSRKQKILFVENVLRGVKPGIVYFNKPSWGGRALDDYDDFVCVDGLQRVTALLDFVDNELPAFGHLYREFEDNLKVCYDIIVNINNLKTRKEVLQWYIELNSYGTPHTKEEIQRVKSLLELEG